MEGSDISEYWYSCLCTVQLSETFNLKQTDRQTDRHIHMDGNKGGLKLSHIRLIVFQINAVTNLK